MAGNTKVNTSRQLLFGADSVIYSDSNLQNNITQFLWVAKNKQYPNFWGRNLVGKNALSIPEIDFLHNKGCRIAPIYNESCEKKTAEQGELIARKIDEIAIKLGITEGTAIFLEIDENEDLTWEFMYGFAKMLILAGYTPGFKANTDAALAFGREYSCGVQNKKDVFKECVIWATSPCLKEYERITTGHFISPDNWAPFAPSEIIKNDISVWQYGKNCHPINDDKGNETTFNLNLVRDGKIVIEKMF